MGKETFMARQVGTSTGGVVLAWVEGPPSSYYDPESAEVRAKREAREKELRAQKERERLRLRLCATLRTKAYSFLRNFRLWFNNCEPRAVATQPAATPAKADTSAKADAPVKTGTAATVRDPEETVGPSWNRRR